ncbi:GTPase ObgE [Bacteroidia bacterium]|nr:GTPase ObgE [Bacteroidia bacterium]MDC1395252.1 GTPase ObgE [Bacteroidia bacterium]
MSNQNFIDYVKICGRSGKGGAGSHSYFRDNLNAKGGPDGGDGGKGGSIILRGNAQFWTLMHLKYKRHIHCQDGAPGKKKHQTGKSGQNQIVEVPLGTLAKHPETFEILGEITEDGEEMVLLRGGKGGLGNANFKSATNQTPKYAQPGQPGREEWFILELKVLADVGLVGLPNAGKSTLLSVLSAAKPEIADYAFTTLTPNLGIVKYRDYKSFVMADIPGIIEGASDGKGLGHRFLRHIERNAALLFMIPADSDDINKEYQILLNELEKFNEELMFKDRILAITKSDMIDDELEAAMREEINVDCDYIFISAVSGKNIPELKDKLWAMMNT